MAAKDIEKAVRAWQLCIGADGYASIKDQQKLYARARRLTSTVATRRDMSVSDAEEQIIREARRRGAIRPQIGKDI